MGQSPDQYDFFVSYARGDNRDGWITAFLAALDEEHRRFSGGRKLTCFFDQHDISSLSDWQEQIFNKGLARSRLFVAFLSPEYFASEWCRREWKAWIDLEIAQHILTAGAAPIYIVEVPGFVSKPPLSELEVARQVAQLCGIPAPHEAFQAAVSPVVKEFRRRQLNLVQPFYQQGLAALQRADLRTVLKKLAEDLDQRAAEAQRAAESENTVPPYNRKFSGRLGELLELRRRLKDDRAGVISGIHGLGGIGKTELAFTYAHAFASAYPGGRFLVPCESKGSLIEAVLHLGTYQVFREHISDEERKTPETYFAAITACVDERLHRLGHVLLVLDNVADPKLLWPQETDRLTVLGPKLHLLATTRLAPTGKGSWFTLGELKPEEALELLEKHRAFANDAEREAAQSIARRLGGFALAVELVAAGLAVHPSATYAGLAVGLGLEDLDTLAADQDFMLQQHNHERRLRAVLEPTLASLKPAEHRVMEYASLLPPDYVPLPWLKELVTEDFLELAKPNRFGDPWDELCLRLERLALFTRVEVETTSRRLIRVHRLVQDVLRADLSAEELTERQERVNALIRARDAVFEKTTRWQEARWELEPLESLALLWRDSEHLGSGWLMYQVATYWQNLAEWSRAEPLMRRALAIHEATYGSNHPRVASDLNNLTVLLQATNRLVEAEPQIRRALAIDEAYYGSEHPDVVRDLNNLVLLLRATNRLTEAEPLMRHALAIDEASLGPEHLDLASNLNNLALLLQDTNRLAEAEPLMRRALAIAEVAYGLEHPRVAIRLNNLSVLLQEMNRLAEAEPLIRRALAIEEASYGPMHPDVARDLSNLARLLQVTNRMGEAEPLMRRALAIDEASYGTEHPVVALCLNNLAQLLRATNRLAEAEPLMRRVIAIYLQFTRDTGHPHPHLNSAVNIYGALLMQIGRSRTETLGQLQELASEFDLEIGG